MRNLLLASSLASIALAACATDMPDPIGGADGSIIDPTPDPDGFVPLISSPWSLAASTEKYVCVRVTMTKDVYIQSIEPIAPVGTHHEVLMLSSNPKEPDGVTDCSSELTEPAIYGSGVGSQRFDFPAGIGLHIKAGQQLFLNLHLFNTSETAITGTAGIKYLEMDPSTIVHEAGSVLAGKTTSLVVPPGPSDQTGTCTTPGGVTMFAVAPHMHLLGTHMKATYQATPDAEPVTVVDTDYSFDDQQYHLFTPITTVAGGKYKVTCSYVNTTGAPVTFGESTTNEMCFAITLLYPPQAQTVCAK